ncbi:hypothetical protein GCM10009780_03220 [Actinomadura alba]
MSYRAVMWEYALWGLLGAAANRALVFLEANRRVKGVAWRFPEGPGGGYFLVACLLHCGIGAALTSAAAATGVIATPLIALGLGATAPTAMAKVGRYALAALPADDDYDNDVDGSGRGNGGGNQDVVP